MLPLPMDPSRVASRTERDDNFVLAIPTPVNNIYWDRLLGFLILIMYLHICFESYM